MPPRRDQASGSSTSQPRSCKVRAEVAIRFAGRQGDRRQQTHDVRRARQAGPHGAHLSCPRPASTRRRRSTGTAARPRAEPFFYFAYGAACSEVTIDTLTGEMRVDRVDILHDVGRSLNPAIDLGQIEGGFVQGMGWLTTEELVFDSRGPAPDARARRPTRSRRVRRAGRFPRRLCAVARQPRADTIYRSKAVGEPPLMLAHLGLLGDHRCRRQPQARRHAAARRAGDAGGDHARRRWPCGARDEDLALDRRGARSRHGRCAMVTVVEAAARRRARPARRIWSSRPDGFHGTIGGGALEWRAIAEAQAALAGRAPAGRIVSVALGPELGQCCGGQVRAAGRGLRARRRARRSRPGRRARGGGASPPSSRWETTNWNVRPQPGTSSRSLPSNVVMAGSSNISASQARPLWISSAPAMSGARWCWRWRRCPSRSPGSIRGRTRFPAPCPAMSTPAHRADPVAGA